MLKVIVEAAPVLIIYILQKATLNPREEEAGLWLELAHVRDSFSSVTGRLQAPSQVCANSARASGLARLFPLLVGQEPRCAHMCTRTTACKTPGGRVQGQGFRAWDHGPASLGLLNALGTDHLAVLPSLSFGTQRTHRGGQ